MKKFTVCGKATISVYIDVEVDEISDNEWDEDIDLEDMAINKAYEEFGGLHALVGNDGVDKIIGVRGRNESIEIDCDVEFENVEER